MDQDNINELINKAVISKNNIDIKNENNIINTFYKAVNDNKKLFESANEIDIKNNNGFILDFIVIKKIFNKYINLKPIINEKKDIILTDNNLLHSKVYCNLGIILTVFDGNTYTMLEMILLGLLTHNTIIFSYDGYMCGTNGLFINIVQSILEKNNIKKDMFQHAYTIKSEDFFNNFKTINKTILIGDNDFINKYIKLCTTEVIISGYKNYDIYIESLENIDLINNILNQYKNVNLYVNNNLKIEFEDAIYVDDIDEAITLINYNSSKYSSSIFTQDNNSASNFIKNINSKNVLVNASPTLQQALDITQKDLLNEKVIIMPNIYNFDGTKINMDIYNN